MMKTRRLVTGKPDSPWKLDSPGKTVKGNGRRLREGTLKSGAQYSVRVERHLGQKHTDSVVKGKQGIYSREKKPKGNITGVVKRETLDRGYGSPRGRYMSKTEYNDGSTEVQKDKAKKVPTKSAKSKKK